MADGIIKSYTVNPRPSRRCDGCGVIVGQESPYKAGLEVREGPVVGFFHNSSCYNNTVEKQKGEQS